MAKRGADKYLTDQNWDQDDGGDAEEVAGEFQKADEQTLKKRVIRKAKRRVVGEHPTSGSAFAGFGGLSAPAQSNKGFQGFNLPGVNKNGAAAEAPKFKGFTGIGSIAGPAPTQFKLQSSIMNNQSIQSNSLTKVHNASPVLQFPTKPANSSMKSSDEEEGSQNSREYNRHLSALNKSVSEWIKNHVEKNPLCDLTPIFRDYQKHLADIDDKFSHSDQESSQSFAVSDSQETLSPKSSRNSSRTSTLSDKPKMSVTALSSSGTASHELTKDSKPSVEVSSLSYTSKPFSGFSSQQKVSSSPFKGFDVPNKQTNTVMPGFSFSASMASSSKAISEASGSTAEEEYVPPKPESKVHEEEDAFFSIRCKLYYKKEDSYADRGIGQLYLKPSGGGKTQLLVRADTAVSQVLLNILLHRDMPLMKQGKNNIMITCIPNPPIKEKEKDKIVPMLIRVKTSDDADNLLKILKEKSEEGSQGAAD